MKSSIVLVAASAAVLLLAGCAEDMHNHREPLAAAEGYDVYYDDFYGPVTDGYWGVDGSFYYRVKADQAFQRDVDGHIRRGGEKGYHKFHVRHGH